MLDSLYRGRHYYWKNADVKKNVWRLFSAENVAVSERATEIYLRYKLSAALVIEKSREQFSRLIRTNFNASRFNQNTMA